MPDILRVGGYEAQLFLPDAPSAHILYLHGSKEEASAIWSLLPASRPVLAVLDGADWNRDFSPWPAQRAFRGGGDFAGGASEYLSVLTREMIPLVESTLPARPESRGLAGYSLAGLFALWAMYQTDLFDCFACVSGSLWYDGFLAYALERRPVTLPRKAYFSLGDREKHTKSPRMAAVEECTRQIAGRFRDLGADTRFEMNPGGHFNDTAARAAKGLAFLSQ